MRLNKSTPLPRNRQLCAWWANNRGREGTNCSLKIVAADAPRASTCLGQTEFWAFVRTGSWHGDVNMSHTVRDRLGLDATDWSALIAAYRGKI